MKNIIKTILSYFNSSYLKIQKEKGDTFSGKFYLTKIKKDKENTLQLHQIQCSKTVIDLKGKNNVIISRNSLIEDSSIVINGNNNTLLISKKVKLRKANIIIRGDNCKVEIGENTTFGGIRIINVGVNNDIIIGSNCLFSDQIEIWASDTHSIFDSDGKQINIEKPIHIGDNVWIGSRVTILKGVNIQSGSVVGMATVVTKEIPKNSISIGSPNRVIKTNISWSLDY